ncbi:hypothetical protein C2869_07725 [Saccharobesus litoralis]|uniref:Cellulose-binding Sde182 nucleoside hydrolase-like domain-containing protein n=2 Tax=Saccharobesus litoralis TaxID=2172099 RepID=A0A2S0VQ32_9ALTE|nr:hypothetical protein C2869_07725 [Saccharobesus litoralis]
MTSDKPNVWVYSDLSDPRDRRSGGHPQTDPDDIVSLASFLLNADRFNIVSVVVGSTNRINLQNPMPFVEQTFVNAYRSDIKRLQQQFPNAQSEINFQWSSLTQKTNPHQFNPKRDYSDLSEFNTVKQLINFAKNNPVAVLSWGPITEPAIAIKHLLDTGDHKTLSNITVISHWTKSQLSQGSVEQPFKVANCWDDYPACDYMHQIALKEPNVKFIEVGSAGQKGLVNGSVNFEQMEQFENSRLGQLFLRGKFYYGKPDQSDAATHWLLTNLYPVNTQTYPNDGSLSIDQERDNVKRFYDAAPAMMQDLAQRNNAAAGSPFTKEHLSEFFTYVYKKKGKYEVYAPYADMNYQVFDNSGAEVKNGKFSFGNQELQIPVKAEKSYQVVVSYGDWQKQYWL